MPGSCANCQGPIDGMGYDQRVEYVRADQRERLRTTTVGRVCKRCALALTDVLRRAGGEPLLAASGVVDALIAYVDESTDLRWRDVMRRLERWQAIQEAMF